MRRRVLYIGATLLLSGLSSCESDFEAFAPADGFVSSVSALGEDFVMEDGVTRTSYEMSDTGLDFTWSLGDTIGIYPVGHDQVAFPISDGAGTKKAYFDGGAWALRSTFRYAGYYPYSMVNCLSPQTAVPISFLGQTQTGNGTFAHLSAYDYQMAAAVQPNNEGGVDLAFKHLAAFVRLNLTIPEATTLTEVKIESDNAEFITEATIDVTHATPSITPVERASFVTLSLEDVVTTAANQQVTLWMMAAPVDLTGCKLTFMAKGSNDMVYTGSVAAGKNMKAGGGYGYTATLARPGTGGTGEDIPFEEDDMPYLTFKAESKTSVKMTKEVPTLEYSVNDGEWQALGTNVVPFGGSLGDLHLRGKSSYGTAKAPYDYANFVFGNTEDVYVAGDIRTLVDYEHYKEADCSKARFCYLFRSCSMLKSAPSLPATTLADHCYSYMFEYCTSLASAPALPATTLAEYCYDSMFDGCKSLTSAPTLPATTLAESCYSEMFYFCTSLTSAPTLPATTLAEYCYSEMFYFCTSLTSAPTLPATTLAEYCYSGMFCGCNSLTSAPALPATTLAVGCYQSMFANCTSLTSAPTLPATTLALECYPGMFYYCTSLTSAPTLPATTLAPGCYAGMFSKCTSLTSAPSLPATHLQPACYRSMFAGCSSLTSAPTLPAATLVQICYTNMFEQCTNLKYVKMLATNVSAQDCVSGFLTDVSPNGTFVKNTYATWNNAEIIPSGWSVQYASE